MAAPADCAIVKAIFPSIDFGSDCCNYTVNNATADVKCTDGRVTRLNLPSMSLNGAIPPRLFDLTALKMISLNSNGFTGGFPADVVKLPNIEEFRIAINTLTGPIPDIFESTPNLRILDLGICSFNGTIPPSIGSASGLSALYLQDNRLYGPIPEKLGNLSSLELFWVDGTCVDTSYLPGKISKVADLRLAPAGLSCEALSASVSAQSRTATTATPTQSPATSNNPATTSTSSSNSTTIIAAAAGGVGAVVVIALAVVGVIVWRRRSRRQSSKGKIVTNGDLTPAGPNPNLGDGSSALAFIPPPTADPSAPTFAPQHTLPSTQHQQPIPRPVAPPRTVTAPIQHASLAADQTAERYGAKSNSQSFKSGEGTTSGVLFVERVVVQSGETTANLPAYAELDVVGRAGTARSGV